MEVALQPYFTHPKMYIFHPTTLWINFLTLRAYVALYLELPKRETIMCFCL